jgi:hypothetical protein
MSRSGRLRMQISAVADEVWDKALPKWNLERTE